MSLGLHSPGDSALHRLPAGAKLVFLCLAGGAIVGLRDWRPLAFILVAEAALCLSARLKLRAVLEQLRPVLWFVALIFVVQLLVSGWTLAIVVVCRILALLILSTLLTLTTRSSDMIEAMERLLRPLARFGVDPEKIALSLSLAIRFVPVIARIATEIREAQWARGADRSAIALIVPLIVRTLKTADEVAEAIDARS